MYTKLMWDSRQWLTEYGVLSIEMRFWKSLQKKQCVKRWKIALHSVHSNVHTSSLKCTANTFASFQMVDQKNAFHSNFFSDASHFFRKVTLNYRNKEFLVHQIYLSKEINLLPLLWRNNSSTRLFTRLLLPAFIYY